MLNRSRPLLPGSCNSKDLTAKTSSLPCTACTTSKAPETESHVALHAPAIPVDTVAAAFTVEARSWPQRNQPAVSFKCGCRLWVVAAGVAYFLPVLSRPLPVQGAAAGRFSVFPLAISAPRHFRSPLPLAGSITPGARGFQATTPRAPQSRAALTPPRAPLRIDRGATRAP